MSQSVIYIGKAVMLSAVSDSVLIVASGNYEKRYRFSRNESVALL